MRECNALFVTRSRLLADLLSRAVAPRLAAAGCRLVAQVVDPENAAAPARAPDAIVLFEGETRFIARDDVAAPVLIVSADLTRVLDCSGADADATLADALARALLARCP